MAKRQTEEEEERYRRAKERTRQAAKEMKRRMREIDREEAVAASTVRSTSQQRIDAFPVLDSCIARARRGELRQARGK
jgi:hypothetical protein